ncbi:MAG: hypothetical protein Kow001_00590 [Acidobacteriota bacterium]
MKAGMKLLAILGMVVTGRLVSAADIDSGPGIPVQVEAKPSADSLLPSALQQAELEQDFARACPHCRVVDREAGFRVVVEDPGTGWAVSVFDGEDHLLRSFRWHGSLSQGLEVAAHLLERFSGRGEGRPAAPATHVGRLQTDDLLAEENRPEGPEA